MMESLLLATCGVRIAPRVETEEIPAALQELCSAIRDREFDAVLTNARYGALVDTQRPLPEKRREIEELLTRCAEQGDVHECLCLLSLGVASLLIYVQHNVTGPEVSCHEETREAVEMHQALDLDGEDFAAKTYRPNLLLLARLILVEPLQLENHDAEEKRTAELQIGDVTLQVAEAASNILSFITASVPSWLWWTGRTIFVHQRFLKHNSATLRKECAALMDILMKEVLVREEWSVASRAQLCLEIAQWELLYRQIQSATDWVHKAEKLLQVKIELSGAMGKRTVHQKDAKAQLIAQIHRSGEGPIETEASESLGQEMSDISIAEDDVLMKPAWEEDVPVPNLSPIEQCLALAQADILELGTAKDDLRSWEIEPFVQLIHSQPVSTFILQSKACLMRVVHECERGRTRERSLLMLEKLAERIRGREVTSERLGFVFCIRMPGILQLRKRLAEHYISFGIIASALEIYEELEMWDELVFCYRLLEKKAIADEIVTQRLAQDPQNPSLLCTLADLRSDPELHSKAWELSQHSYPRAQRSLARLALEKKDYKAASVCFELALKLNTLHPDAWFALGYCYLKLDDDINALKAFTWCAQLEPENGEAWNNLAALWMRQKKADRALWALKEAVKYTYRSWETWENYAKASQECKEYSLAIHGMNKVLELSDGQRLQPDLLISLIDAVLELPQESDLPGQMNKLYKQLEAFLQRASDGAGWRPEFWLSFAQLHHRLEQPCFAKECLTKCFRHLQGSAWKSDPSRFALLVRVVAAFVDHYRTGASQEDLASLSLQLRGIVKQAEWNYVDTEDFQNLQALQSHLLQLQRKDAL